jgi:hypothetical protein
MAPNYMCDYIFLYGHYIKSLNNFNRTHQSESKYHLTHLHFLGRTLHMLKIEFSVRLYGHSF